jgi:hypothetical protein
MLLSDRTWLERDRSATVCFLLSATPFACVLLVAACSPSVGNEGEPCNQSGSGPGTGASCNGNLVCDQNGICEPLGSPGPCRGTEPGPACGPASQLTEWDCVPGARPPSGFDQACQVLVSNPSETAYCCVGGGYCFEGVGACTAPMVNYLCGGSQSPSDTMPELSSCARVGGAVTGASYCCMPVDAGVGDGGDGG